ncbi:MAG: DNRLRE domain-containing protein [Terriglobales bacterium]|jgi:hypothetical protein
MNKKNPKTQLAVLLLSALCLLPSAHAQITPLGDSYTNTADSSKNYGTATLLYVDGATEVAYIQFNLASIPTGASVSQATLKLYVNSVTTAGSFNVDYVNGTWTEGMIDASNAPPLGTTIASNVAITTADKNQYILINLTPAVQAWLNGSEANDGIALVANGSFNATFDSKENTTTSHPAELDIVFAGDGTITGVTTASGSGLTGGGTSGTLNLSLTNACAANQVLQWNGSAWICASVGTGTVTSVAAGTGLTASPSPITTSGTLSINTSVVPQLGAANNFTGANTFTGNQTVSGNLSANGFQIGSNLFDYGSYANGNAFLGFAGNSNGSNTGKDNTASGAGALASNTSGGSNTASGYQALYSNTTGAGNTASGFWALRSDTTGSSNTAIGVGALYTNTTNSGNVAVGFDTLYYNTGGYNTASGYEALYSNTGGSYNAAVGNQALQSNTSGGFNTATGSSALQYNTTGSYNTAGGVFALQGNTTGRNNTANGWEALNLNTTGQNNTANGWEALNLNTTGSDNTANGYSAGITLDFSNVTSIYNTAVGAFAGFSTGSLSNATAIGANAVVGEPNALVLGSGANVGIGTSTPAFPLDVVGNINSSTGFTLTGQPFAFGSYANYNAFFGFAGNSTTTGQSNTAVGAFALAENNQGFYNTAVGGGALQTHTTGSLNTALGLYAGFPYDSSSVTGNLNTLVGGQATLSTGNLNNATAIGAFAEVSESNALVLGSFAASPECQAYQFLGCANTYVGIGKTNPGATLDVQDIGTGGSTISSNTARITNAVYGANSSTSGGGANGGFFITASPQGAGVVGVNTGTGGDAGYFQGNVYITGNLTKSTGTFLIDHPLDPANKYLYHSFVESPDMMNIYNGVATLDARGSVWITLPEYFEALNQDFRYQLTSIGRPQPSLYVAKEISGNRFRISGGKPGGKVSWQVTGIRHDAYADAHRIKVEVEKPPQEQGRYLHPELFGAPAEQAIGYHAPPVPTKLPAQDETPKVSSLKTPPVSLK